MCNFHIIAKRNVHFFNIIIDFFVFPDFCVTDGDCEVYPNEVCGTSLQECLPSVPLEPYLSVDNCDYLDNNLDDTGESLKLLNIV